jgi:alpha-glucosidase/alpha-D-xyloside xylohydrolase
VGIRLPAVARTLAGPEEVMRIARTFREKKLPCDALIYLGTEFTPPGWNTRNGEFSWKAENFPDPKNAIATLHEQHYKVAPYRHRGPPDERCRCRSMHARQSGSERTHG